MRISIKIQFDLRQVLIIDLDFIIISLVKDQTLDCKTF